MPATVPSDWPKNGSNWGLIEKVDPNSKSGGRSSGATPPNLEEKGGGLEIMGAGCRLTHVTEEAARSSTSHRAYQVRHTYPVNTTVWVSLAPVFRSTPRAPFAATAPPFSKQGVSDDLEHLAAVEPSGGGGFVIADEAFRRGDAGAQRG